MATIPEFIKQRESKYFDLVVLKDDIQEFIKSPVDTVSIHYLKYQYAFLLLEIKNIDASIKNIILCQIETAKLDLKNLETQLTMFP
ncbi:hypothetical protein [Flavobacterium franklandianum]|uniref:Uncharacterized protein n=1 Tax=Flavobacterium franklandianum TaxID=2594430 RepID=A0A553C8J2_9FLAO|nr:hypothetical protein [Flavobacterium franklandianum]TRX16732.1 hypothetical protein FNW17_12275 [Flavobacterium franklandianum]